MFSNSTTPPLSFPPAQIEYFHKVQVSKYFSAASVTILYFDYFLTIDQEIEHVWNSPFSFITVLFFITRYLPFLDTAPMMAHYYAPHPSNKACSILYHTEAWCYTFGITIAEGILAVRTYAIWDRKKLVGATLLAFLIGFAFSAGYFLQKFIASLEFMPSPVPVLKGCFAFKANDLLYITYSVLLANETSMVFTP